MLTTIVQILLLLTILVQLVLSIYMLCNTHRQYKNDKKFYDNLLKSLEEQSAVFLDEGAQCEQVKDTESKK